MYALKILLFLSLEASRKDDLESIFYNLIFFLKGDLPWRINSNIKDIEILDQKINFTSSPFCFDIPSNYS